MISQPERFDGQREHVLLGELLVRERGPEVGVALADERQGALACGVREAAAIVQTPDLALTQAQELGRSAPSQPPLGH